MKFLSNLIILFLAISSSTYAVDFKKDIKPLLESRCISCHSSTKQKGDLNLSTLLASTKGGDSGAAVTPNNPDASLLIERISLPHDDEEIMPPKGEPLNQEEISLLTSWIQNGAQWPDELILVHREPMSQEDIANDSSNLAGVQIFPPKVSLNTNSDLQRLVAVATYNDGTTRDITDKVEFETEDPSLVTIEGNLFRPRSDGDTSIKISFHGKSASTPIKITDSEKERPISFRLDVMPVFMRASCNNGSCHGSARGQDGFMLSLFGYDPVGDYHRVTRELSGRRIDLAYPAESLLVEKAIEAVPHTGGKLFNKDSEYHDILVSWLQAGAPDDPKDVATPTSLNIYPDQAVLEGKGRSQQFIAVAGYSDGTTRDVTS